MPPRRETRSSRCAHSRHNFPETASCPNRRQPRYHERRPQPARDDAAASGLGQQLLNHPLRLFVFSLAEVMMSNAPLPIDEIEGRPGTATTPELLLTPAVGSR